MVAKIKIKNALAANFYYNENKVSEGVAMCLAAENYPADLEHLSQPQRLKMLQKLAGLNEAIKVNSVHISLNFDPSENLTAERLKDVAMQYMDRIGFGPQPYLVYQHFDAGHPHIHILSVKVGMDGKGLDTHNIAIKKSEPARKELEQQFGLVRAEDMNRKQYSLKPAYAQKIEYGKSESRRAIANVLDNVLQQYKYTSLAELNAVLRQYNVMADRCRETSRVYKNHGLLYRILDDKGQSVGVPIKASAFHNKPTLTFLEEKFQLNEAARQPLKKRVKNAIDLYFFKQPNATMAGMIKALQKDGIHTTLRQNDSGLLYGITYIDHKNKVVFNGSDLGKPYSAKGIQEKCLSTLSVTGGKGLAFGDDPQPKAGDQQGQTYPDGTDHTANEKGFLELLTQSEDQFEPTPHQLKKTKRKKRRRPSNDR